MRGRLITIEGLDGAGKSTLAAALQAELAATRPVTVLRDPGGVALSERVRAIVKDPELRCGARAEALLYAAARAQLVEEQLEPMLAAGTWVLLDRFVDSSLAYQGAGRGLGVEEVATLNAFATAGVVPDRTLLLRVAPATARKRLHGRDDAPDRLELEAPVFFERIAAAYDALAAADPRRIRVLDGDRDQNLVVSAALDALADLDSRAS